jgi:hypothetical protein
LTALHSAMTAHTCAFFGASEASAWSVCQGSQRQATKESEGRILPNSRPDASRRAPPFLMMAPLSRPMCGISLGLYVYQNRLHGLARGLFFFMARLCDSCSQSAWVFLGENSARWPVHSSVCRARTRRSGLALAFWNSGSHGARREGILVGTYLFSNERCDPVISSTRFSFFNVIFSAFSSRLKNVRV